MFLCCGRLRSPARNEKMKYITEDVLQKVGEIIKSYDVDAYDIFVAKNVNGELIEIIIRPLVKE